MLTFPVGAFLNERWPAECGTERANSRACALSGARVFAGKKEHRPATAACASPNSEASGGVTKPAGVQGGRGQGGGRGREERKRRDKIERKKKERERNGGGTCLRKSNEHRGEGEGVKEGGKTRKRKKNADRKKGTWPISPANCYEAPRSRPVCPADSV